VRHERLALGALLGLFVLRCAHTAWVTSPTFDESQYVFCGYSYWVEGRFDRSYEHPPLAKAIVSAPLLLLRPVFAPDAEAMRAHHNFEPYNPEPEFPLGFQFVFLHNRDRAQLLVFTARLAAIAVAAAAALAVRAWARALYGPAAGLLALFLVTFDPNVLAHAPNASGDVILAAAVLGACFAWWRFLGRETWGRLLVAGVLLGAAVAVRVIGGLAAGMFALMALAARAGAPGGAPASRASFGPGRWRLVPQGLVVGATALLVLFAIYGFETGRPVDRLKWPQVVWLSGGENPLGRWAETTLPMPNLVLGFLYQAAHVAHGHRAFLHGELSFHGWWYYFPVVFALKTPLGLLLLAALALWTVLRAARVDGVRREITCLLPLGLWVGFCLWSPINLGYRFLLPALLLLLVPVSRVVVAPAAGGRGRGVAVAVLCAWIGVSSLRIHPHYLAYFNEAAGGPRHGHEWLVDSNLDWGQSLPALRAWMDAHGVDEVNLAYFGTADPAYYGIRYQYLPSYDYLRPEVRYDPARHPPARYFAISATNLRGPYFLEPDRYRAFRDLEPVGHAGWSILLYDRHDLEGAPGGDGPGAGDVGGR
jgi:hypothetical protein